MDSLLKKINEKINSLVPIDNDAFSYFASDKMFCQEFLRVILEDSQLEIIDNKIQNLIPNMYFKTVILDMLCTLSDGRIVNVEIQLYKDKFHAKRIFQYASMIKQVILEKGEKYKNVSDIVIIYLTKEDVFKKGCTIYDVEMNVVSDKKIMVEKWQPGLIIKYVNTEGLTNKKINEYLQLLKDTTSMSENYKEVSRMKKDVYEKGGAVMSTWFQELVKEESEKCRAEGIQQGIEQGIEQGTINILNKLVKQGLLTKEEAKKQLANV